MSDPKIWGIVPGVVYDHDDLNGPSGPPFVVTKVDHENRTITMDVREVPPMSALMKHIKPKLGKNEQFPFVQIHRPKGSR